MVGADRPNNKDRTWRKQAVQTAVVASLFFLSYNSFAEQYSGPKPRSIQASSPAAKPLYINVQTPGTSSCSNN